ncbi:MAG: acetoin utilization protein AcuC [Heliobacteriaceae bacterium]|nr:acetoin utilization protein AcuC [Heliobacteriaceae bacterium]MDD4587876.1 acetoin utilization protein AcuC [Heliobacteriaceae bacterium]
MAGCPLFIYSPRLLGYRFGPAHPFDPLRLEVTVDLIRQCGLLASDQVVEPELCSREDLVLIHHERFLDALELASRQAAPPNLLHIYGFHSDDSPAFPGMAEASRLIVGATLLGAKLIMAGKANHVLQISGGLHHAGRNRASGFCILNDAAVAIAYLQRHFGLRIAYIDTDAHHGDGVQAIFYDDPTVLTISIHEKGRFLFPGTGDVEERGRFAGYGFSFNLPLEPYTEDDSYIEVYEQAVEPLIAAFKPDLILTQNGCDGHHLDPLTHLALTTRTYETIPKLVHRLAHKYCAGRWLALGGGGYDHWRVVPRAWTLLWAEMNDQTVPDQLPLPWQVRWQPYSPVPLPVRLRDGINEFPPIPWREAITAKNRATLQQALRGVAELIASQIGE